MSDLHWRHLQTKSLMCISYFKFERTFLCDKHYMQGTIVAMAAKMAEYGLFITRLVQGGLPILPAANIQHK